MKKPCKERSLAYLDVELSKEWDYEKNYPLTPDEVFAHSHKKLWWKCKKCHNELWASPHERNNHPEFCRGCNSLALVNPELAKEWHPDKNGKLTSSNIAGRSGKKVWWKCKKGHEWMAKVSDRQNNRGCPYCSGRKVNKENCLATVSPKLAKEWNHKKNGKMTTSNVTPHSQKKVWWKCKKGHEWEAVIGARSKGSGCPYCSGNRACKDNCLATVNPKLAKEWNYKKNGKLTPSDVTSGANKSVWWKCKKGHEWVANICSRNNSGSGCLDCSKIELKNGIICDSMPEAYYYLKLQREGVKFRHHVKINLGRCVCDFYISNTNKYIEVTGYSDKWKYWDIYYKNILKKKKHITKGLKAKFEFIQLSITNEQRKYVRENSI